MKLVTDHQEIRELAYKFSAGLKPNEKGGAITTQGSKINVKFYNKRVEKQWQEYCDTNNIILDKGLKY